MTKEFLDNLQGRPSFKQMSRKTVPQCVWGHAENAYPYCGTLYKPVHSPYCKAFCPFFRYKDGTPVSLSGKKLPIFKKLFYTRTKRYKSFLGTFSQYPYYPLVYLNILPMKIDQFRNTQT